MCSTAAADKAISSLTFYRTGSRNTKKRTIYFNSYWREACFLGFFLSSSIHKILLVPLFICYAFGNNTRGIHFIDIAVMSNMICLSFCHITEPNIPEHTFFATVNHFHYYWDIHFKEQNEKRIEYNNIFANIMNEVLKKISRPVHIPQQQHLIYWRWCQHTHIEDSDYNSQVIDHTKIWSIWWNKTGFLPSCGCLNTTI